MELTITPIGTGNAFTRTGFETNYLVRCGKTSLLIDCGTTAERALAEIDLSFTDIDRVYISHLHLDHVGGLPGLAVMRYLQKRERPEILLHEDLHGEIWDGFLKTFLGHYLDREGTGQKADRNTFFSWQSLRTKSEAPVRVGDLSLRLVRVEHVPGMTSHGLVLNEIVFITTDTVFSPDILESLANRFNLQAIFHDCSFSETRRHLHSTYQELRTLPQDLKDLLILTHYEDEFVGRDDVEITLGQAGRSYTFS